MRIEEIEHIESIEFNWTLHLENHEFLAGTKVFIVDFDNINSSKDLVHALAKVNMMKYAKLREEAFLEKKQIEKDNFESMIMFLSTYSKAKDMNARLNFTQ